MSNALLQPGTLLSSRYRINSVLGQGGMGAVYLANMDALGGKKVAVKEMEFRSLSSLERQQAVTQFGREASFLANLKHPNLVEVTDFFREGDKHYLVMAYVKGQSLQEKFAALGRPYRWDELVGWAQRLVEVLSYLHNQTPPILFRDLKPSNIMIADCGRLSLIDFGIARTAQQGDRTSTFLQGIGTSGFSPIEQYGTAQSTDQRSDIYSLGATLYYLLTGVVPPDAVDRVSDDESLVPASRLAPGLPPGMDRMLERALAVRRRDRHQDLESFRREMLKLECAVPLSAPLTQPLRVDPMEQPTESIKVELFPSGRVTDRDRSTPWALALGSLALLGSVLLLWARPSIPKSAELPRTSPVTQAAPERIVPMLEASVQPVDQLPSTQPRLPVSFGRRPSPRRPGKTTKPTPPAQPKKAVQIKRPSAIVAQNSYPKAKPRPKTVELDRSEPQVTIPPQPLDRAPAQTVAQATTPTRTPPATRTVVTPPTQTVYVPQTSYPQTTLTAATGTVEPTVAPASSTPAAGSGDSSPTVATTAVTSQVATPASSGSGAAPVSSPGSINSSGAAAPPPPPPQPSGGPPPPGGAPHPGGGGPGGPGPGGGGGR